MCIINDTIFNAVLSVIDNFAGNWDAFTALDVSNKVKETLPHVRHREVAPIVHQIMANDFDDDYTGSQLDLDDYTESQIDVTTGQGRVIQARLYHPVWDDNLDLIYPVSKRQQKPIPPKAATVPLATPVVVDTTATNETAALDLIRNTSGGIFASDIRHALYNTQNINPRDIQDAINNLIGDNKIEVDIDGRLHICQKAQNPLPAPVTNNMSVIAGGKIPAPVSVSVNEPISLTGSVKTIATGAVKVFRGFLQR